MAAPQTSLLAEVRGFLDGLKDEWPDLFARKPKAALAPPAAVPAPAPSGPVAFAPIPAPPPGARPREAPPAEDLVELFRARASHWASVLGVTFGHVRVKDQRSLWGSCSREGNLNFNWRIALAPDCVIDYLVVHELAHRAHMDHSRRFWEFVERVCPAHRHHRRWLRVNGETLYRAKR